MSDWKLDEVGGAYGAPMGRADCFPEAERGSVALIITPLRMVDGDYDEGGAYWGATDGTAMYCAHGETEEGETVEIFHRANSREEAKAYFESAFELRCPEFEFITIYDSGFVPFCDLREFERAYFECMFWMNDDGCGGGEYRCGEYWYNKLHPNSFETQMSQCQEFQQKASSLLGEAYALSDYSGAQAGHDFALTRCGAGTGFWDREQLEGRLGQELTRLSKDFGEVWCSFPSSGTEDGESDQDYVFIE